jgi:hypothetical protein
MSLKEALGWYDQNIGYRPTAALVSALAVEYAFLSGVHVKYDTLGADSIYATEMIGSMGGAALLGAGVVESVRHTAGWVKKYRNRHTASPSSPELT